jgi:hypothetical protein
VKRNIFRRNIFGIDVTPHPEVVLSKDEVAVGGLTLPDIQYVSWVDVQSEHWFLVNLEHVS